MKQKNRNYPKLLWWLWGQTIWKLNWRETKRPLEHTSRVGEGDEKIREKQQGKNTNPPELNVCRTDKPMHVEALAQYLRLCEASTTAGFSIFFIHTEPLEKHSHSHNCEGALSSHSGRVSHTAQVVNRKRKKKKSMWFAFHALPNEYKNSFMSWEACRMSSNCLIRYLTTEQQGNRED